MENNTVQWLHFKQKPMIKCEMCQTSNSQTQAVHGKNLSLSGDLTSIFSWSF